MSEENRRRLRYVFSSNIEDSDLWRVLDLLGKDEAIKEESRCLIENTLINEYMPRIKQDDGDSETSISRSVSKSVAFYVSRVIVAASANSGAIGGLVSVIQNFLSQSRFSQLNQSSVPDGNGNQTSRGKGKSNGSNGSNGSSSTAPQIEAYENYKDAFY